MAGWLSTRWREEGPLQVSLLAWGFGSGGRTWMTDEDGARWPVELPLVADGGGAFPGSWFYLLSAEVSAPQEVPPGRYLVGLETELDAGVGSHLWPFLEVRARPTPTPSPPPEATATPEASVIPTQAATSAPTPDRRLLVRLTANVDDSRWVPVPVTVRFQVSVENASPAATYRLDFADAEWLEGSVEQDFPGGWGEIEHRYQIHTRHRYAVMLEVWDGSEYAVDVWELTLTGDPISIASVEIACPHEKPPEWDCQGLRENQVMGNITYTSDCPPNYYTVAEFRELGQTDHGPGFNRVPRGDGNDPELCVMYTLRGSRRGYLRVEYAGRLEGIARFDCPE